ncbi:MAG: transposase [Kiritimatiellaeota bacterium]|nr:transposase [Kiritimatiellota bacterium]
MADEAVKTPPRSPNLNAFAERFVRTVKEECLCKYILFSGNMLKHVLKEFVAHYHAELSKSTPEFNSPADFPRLGAVKTASEAASG